jgi:hypothetical protein
MENSDRIRKEKKEHSFYLVHTSIALLLGLFIYIVFRPDTYISKYLLGYTHLRTFSNYILVKDNCIILFTRNYLCDILWAYALTFAAWTVGFSRVRREYLSLGGSCILFELLVEIMQKFHIISGTFDILDILMEIAATWIALVIIMWKRERFKK